MVKDAKEGVAYMLGLAGKSSKDGPKKNPEESKKEIQKRNLLDFLPF